MFAFVNATLAAVAPHARLHGMDAERAADPSATVRRREAAFLAEHRLLAMIAIREGTTIPTIVQTIARRVRYQAPSRAHVLRFLREAAAIAASEVRER